MQEQIFDIIFDKDEITWQSMIYDLVKAEGMDPWDIDISLLTKRFLDKLREYKKTDLRISGKALLAAAILLKIKSNRLIGEDLDALDRLFAGSSEEEAAFDEELIFRQEGGQQIDEDLRLISRTPQERKRKVSIYDLVDALQKAMEVKKRRLLRLVPDVEPFEVPERKMDIGDAIKKIYARVKMFFSASKSERLTFSRLVPSDSKYDKVYTFIPLLHLANHDQNKVDLIQEEHFGEIEIRLIDELKDLRAVSSALEAA